MITSCRQNVIQNQNIVIGNLLFENVGKFRYLGVTVTNRPTNDIRKEIKLRINMGNACYYSFEKLLSSSLLPKKFKVKTYKTIILPVVLYRRLRVLENKVLRKIYEAKEDKITGEWRKLHNAELHALYSSPNIIRNLKSRRLRWAGHLVCMELTRNAYRNPGSLIRTKFETPIKWMEVSRFSSSKEIAPCTVCCEGDVHCGISH